MGIRNKGIVFWFASSGSSFAFLHAIVLVAALYKTAFAYRPVCHPRFCPNGLPCCWQFGNSGRLNFEACLVAYWLSCMWHAVLVCSMWRTSESSYCYLHLRHGPIACNVSGSPLLILWVSRSLQWGFFLPSFFFFLRMWLWLLAVQQHCL